MCGITTPAAGRGGSCELMIGCIAKAHSEDLSVDYNEMEDIQWMDRSGACLSYFALSGMSPWQPWWTGWKPAGYQCCLPGHLPNKKAAFGAPVRFLAVGTLGVDVFRAAAPCLEC